MSSRGSKTGALIATLPWTTLGMLTGCARPAGPLFETMASPLVWPGPPERARIRYVGAISSSSDLSAAVTAGEAFASVLRGPRPPIGMSSPNGVARTGGSLLAVTDPSLSATAIINLDTREYTLSSGATDALFDAPIGVTWAGRKAYVTDAARHEVFTLTASGTCVDRFGTEELTRPVGIVYVEPRDQLYVVDGGAHQIVVFEREGRLVRRIGGNGLEPGQFNYPSHIAWDGGNRLAVADSGNFRVQLLDLDGACLEAIGRKGDAAGDFALPKGVAFDSEGHLYVVDAQFENVQIFDERGRLLLAFGREGNAAGQFSLPAGLTIDDQDRIWVADSANRRVQVFDYIREVK